MDAMRNAMFFGLGAISLTKDKAEEIIDDLVRRGEMSESDRAGMVEKMLKEGETQKIVLERNVAALVQKAMTDMGFPTQKDVEGMSDRLDRIDQALATMKRQKHGRKS
jgi:polyhydroxyalkanoate synthesis regulator phasin